MGDDTPVAVLSKHDRSLFDYFRQLFAQVTNPPIDPIRETLMMSLLTAYGPRTSPFSPKAEGAKRLESPSPVLTRAELTALRAQFNNTTVPLLFYANVDSLEGQLTTLCEQAIEAVTQGANLLILSDRGIEPGRVPVPVALALGAIHHQLIEKGLRHQVNLVVETAGVRNSHHLAVLLGYGATAVYPYLAEASIVQKARLNNEAPEVLYKRLEQFRHALDTGLYKIMSKMGISTLSSYRGAQLFECLGFDETVVNGCFKGSTSRIGGTTFVRMQERMERLNREAFQPAKPLAFGGLIKFTPRGENHGFNPDVVMALQQAVTSNKETDYQHYADLVNQRTPLVLRDLFTVKQTTNPLSLDNVEPAESILKRFNSAAMSLGSLSPEAHEALAEAMNRLGGRSNSGEGGEDSARFNSPKVSKIKQIASGRFGVTPAYLMSADVLQIKVAQGAKPGEGGQLPGYKVNELIARLRHTTIGTTLISPPPHHDIYSIEDLAQLIFDLKQINPRALVSVKLVAEPGVGTIAAGVAKTYADWISIAGYDGGTGASPLTSIKHAGVPWELGLSETHQTLKQQGLRGRVLLEGDGGLKTGLDVIKASLLGAEAFTFGTAPMVALGCKYLRICHLNTCATGVATQQDRLRQDHFVGSADKVERYFRFVAEEVRQWLAKLGVARLDELIGRTDYLSVLPSAHAEYQLTLDSLLAQWPGSEQAPDTCQQERNPSFDKGELAETMVEATLPAIEAQQSATFDFKIRNTNRSIGARVSGEIANRYGDTGLEQSPLTLRFRGTAGQSFGVWNVEGMHLELVGEANDYVGKGMAGGSITIRSEASAPSQESALIGNTCLYGATGGTLFAAGRAGQRFAVRNSGATAVIEGAGDHACEYMTGGVVVILGDVGMNLAAGMSGGVAYLYDPQQLAKHRLNGDLAEVRPLERADDRQQLQQLIQDYVNATHSNWGKARLAEFSPEDYQVVRPSATWANLDEKEPTEQLSLV